MIIMNTGDNQKATTDGPPYAAQIDRGQSGHPERKKQTELLLPGPSVVFQLLQAIDILKYKIALTSVYAAGLGTRDVVHLKKGDIDRRRMIILVGDVSLPARRHVVLVAPLLHLLRDYWKIQNPPGDWLFPGNLDCPGPVSESALTNAFRKAAIRLGWKEDAGISTLRECFAAHTQRVREDVVRSIHRLLLKAMPQPHQPCSK